MRINLVITILILAALAGVLIYRNSRQIKLPKGETKKEVVENIEDKEKVEKEIMITKGVKHSIPLDEILSGGPPKDGIPSIDNPKFLSVIEGNKFLNDEAAGQGLCIGQDGSAHSTNAQAFGSEAQARRGGEQSRTTGSPQDCRFYPYQILVWHEIVNDTVGSEPVLITYCPLCLTGIVFDRKLEGRAVEFGTSGKLWRSNLVMYNRTDDPKKESLWSQVLGEAIVGEFIGTKLKIIPSDIIKYGDWKKLHPNTKILSKDTGFIRSYGYDPYGDYYTSREVSFGATFDDKRLHPKEFVLGIQIKGEFKAYHSKALKIGETKDIFNGQTIFINKKPEGEIRMFKGINREPLPYIGAFWFSWLNAHPETEIYK